MKKNLIKKIIAISLSVIVLVVACFFIFKRDFDSLVEKAAKALNNYNIQAEIDSENKTIEASQTVEVKNNYGMDIDALYFHLYPRAFREGASIKPYTTLNQGKCFSNGDSYGNLEITSVKTNNQQQDIVYDGEDENVLKVKCDLKKEQSVVISLKFIVTLPNCNHRFGYMDSNINLGNWYPVLAHFDGEKFDLSPYYSTGDPFCSEMANYNLNLTFSNELVCATTGNIIKEEVGAKKHIEVQAKAVRDVALVLSSKFNLKKIELKNTTVNYFGYAGDSDLDEMASLVKDGLEFFNAKFGEYPYRQISVVKTPFLFGGMEYPNFVMIADNIEEKQDKARVIIHEIAHQWWYGLVGNNQIAEAWIDESLTEYSAFLFFENYPEYGLNYKELIEDASSTYDLYVDVITSLGGVVNYSMIDSVEKYSSEYEYSYMIYVKGVIMYDDIRNVVGDKKFYKTLQKYYKNYRFKIVTGDDLINCFEKTTGVKLRDKFNAYLLG